MNPEQEKRLERLVSNVVRDLPPRRAPSSLESRVQAEIARRAALPWWRKSFVSWPVAARGAFVCASVGVVVLAFYAFGWISQSVDVIAVRTMLAADLHRLQVGRDLVATLVHSVNVGIGSIPTLWLYGGLAAIAALYVALFGLGAAAYRTLYASR